MRTSAWIIFAISMMALLYCGYAYAFWAWVTATPLDPEQLARAQYDAKAWLVLAALSLVGAVISLIFARRPSRQKM